jgi:hypothetical protein
LLFDLHHRQVNGLGFFRSLFRHRENLSSSDA